ncbi:MAG: glycosyltransferase family 4 protein, partial [Bacteroidales bacterium]
MGKFKSKSFPRTLVVINQDAGYLTIDVLNNLSNEYDEVIFVTGKVNFYNRTLNTNIKIVRTFKYNRRNLFTKLLSWMLCFFHIVYLLKTRYTDSRILFYSNPPIGPWASLVCSNIFAVMVFDVYPESLKLMGITEHSMIYKVWLKLNQRAYEKAEKVYTISKKMAGTLSKIVSEDKISVIPLWPAYKADEFENINKTDNLSFGNLLNSKFIVLYAGTLGLGHHIESIYEVVKKLKYNDKIHFLVIGNGSMKPWFETKVIEDNLINCTLLSRQSDDNFKLILDSAKIGIVSLNEQLSESLIPSKTFNYLAAHLPLLVIGGMNSELREIVEKFQIGQVFKP